MKVFTSKEKGKTFHIINGIKISCSGRDCNLCKSEAEERFKKWQNTIPFPIPPKGKRYKNGLKQQNRGKTITEICYTCKKIPCWICRRSECPEWMREPSRKGQEQGCSHWQADRCTAFVCEKGLITTKWF